MTLFRHSIPRRMTYSMLRPFAFGRLRPFHLIASAVGRRRKLIHENATSLHSTPVLTPGTTGIPYIIMQRLGQRLPSFFLPYNACIHCPASFRCLVIDVAQNHSLISHSLETQWPPPCASLVGSFSPAFHRMTILLVLGSCIALESTPMGDHVG